MPFAEVSAGAIFALDYRILSLLGKGGMGAVYAVEQLSTGRKLALKLMLQEHVSNRVLFEKFLQEMKISSQIDSEHVAHVIGAGVEPTSGTPWLTMELLDGETLQERVDRAGPMQPAAVLDVVEQICHALGAAHASGIVHRDMKLENVFLAKKRVVGRSEIVKVLDFGIAKVFAQAGTTRTGVIGTPVYMAPEQFEGRGIRAQTDLWALGLITFHVLTGGPYWRRSSEDSDSSPTSLMYQICMGELPLASTRAAELGVRLPEGFDRWFARCVVRDRAQRYASAEELFAGLRAAGVEQPAPVTASDLRSEPADAASPSVSGPTPAQLAAVEEAKSAPSGTGSTDAPDTFYPAQPLTLAAEDISTDQPRSQSRAPVRMRTTRRGLLALGALAACVVGTGLAWPSSRQSGSSIGAKDLAKAETPTAKPQLACDRGGGRECVELGTMFEKGSGGLTKDEQRAAELFNLGCARGDAGGCYTLARNYAGGLGGVPKDEKRAAELYNLSCERGDPLGCAHLANYYWGGVGGLPKDEKRAAELYNLSCERGGAMGCDGLGRIYEGGLGGLPKDAKRAVELYQLACDRGDALGCNDLGREYQSGAGGLPKDEKRAVELYQLACDRGDALGCNDLGREYQSGAGRLPKDEKRAEELFKLSCDRGDATGCRHLAASYWSSRGLPKDEKRAAELYKLACDRGDATGCAFLGRIYESGRGGLPKDESRAVGLYKLACDRGDATGCGFLRAMHESGRARRGQRALPVDTEPLKTGAATHTRIGSSSTNQRR
ncbi:MAG: hypothetical protein JWN04_2399 [Myxococcaceae bacterium]|nr:hypothetical protein [Myxococcaceae bacterium]